MLQNRNLSNNDKKRLLLLATKEIENVDSATESKEEGTLRKESKNEKKNKGAKSKHAPKDTAAFLSLFNDPKGFKFLTHGFDPSAELT